MENLESKSDNVQNLETLTFIMQEFEEKVEAFEQFIQAYDLEDKLLGFITSKESGEKQTIGEQILVDEIKERKDKRIQLRSDLFENLVSPDREITMPTIRRPAMPKIKGDK